MSLIPGGIRYTACMGLTTALHRWLAPDWATRKRMLYREAVVVVAAAYVLLIAAWTWPGSLEAASTPAVLWTWVTMLVRGLSYHLGLLVMAIGVVAAVARR